MIQQETTLKCDSKGCQESLRTFERLVPIHELKREARKKGWRINEHNHFCPVCSTLRHWGNA